jgi:CRP-like cAMP-binding protein
MPNHESLPAIHSQVKNRILLALPEEEFQRIFPHLAFVRLRPGQVLYDADNWINYAYFINSGMASLVVVNVDGETIEIGPVGSEGIMGFQAALGDNRLFYTGVVQIPGNAMRIKLEALRYEFQRNGELARLLLNSVRELHLHVGQSAVCNRIHSLEQRLCRWLLASQDHAMLLDRLPVTQEFLSHTMSATRSAVMLTTESLHEAGLIAYRRSGIRIVDREEIEARACECYRNVHPKFSRLSVA